MKVLGIDPGTRILGYAIVDCKANGFCVCDYGVIRARVKDPMHRRLHHIYHNLTQIITVQKPQVAAIEKVFCGKNVQSAIRIGEARGVIFLAVANASLPVYEYDATKIKKSVVGTGTAHKSQIQHMIKNILQLDEIPTPADAADALAIAICHSQQCLEEA